MINDFIINIFDFINNLYISLGASTVVQNLIEVFTKINDYSTSIQYYLSGAYYVFGKSLVQFTFTASGFVFVFRFLLVLILFEIFLLLINQDCNYC